MEFDEKIKKLIGDLSFANMLLGHQIEQLQVENQKLKDCECHKHKAEAQSNAEVVTDAIRE